MPTLGPSITVDSFGAERFTEALKAYMRATRRSVPAVLRDQGKQLARRLISGPRVTSDDGAVTRGIATPPSTRAEGKRAVKRDISRVFRSLKPREFDDKRIRKLIRERNEKAIQAIFDNSKGALHGFRLKSFDAKLHQDQRNRRGRVREKPDRVATFEVEKVSEYIKRIQERVGRAKGGWARPLALLGGRTSSWVSRWEKLGSMKPGSSQSIVDFVRFENRSEWASGGDEDRIVDQAMLGRAESIANDIRRRLEKESQRLGIAA